MKNRKNLSFLLINQKQKLLLSIQNFTNTAWTTKDHMGRSCRTNGRSGYSKLLLRIHQASKVEYNYTGRRECRLCSIRQESTIIKKKLLFGGLFHYIFNGQKEISNSPYPSTLSQITLRTVVNSSWDWRDDPTICAYRTFSYWCLEAPIGQWETAICRMTAAIAL